MTTIIDGNSLGLANSALHTMGLAPGDPLTGRGGECVYVNAATGNLVLQRQDELLFGRGPEMAALRTYNSQGQADGDNNDNWRIGFYRQVSSLTGTLDSAGSTISRVDGDGAGSVFAFDSRSGKYVSRIGGGAFDTLSWDAAASHWLWVDGGSGVSEVYQGSTAYGPCLLVRSSDASGNSLSYRYNAQGLLERVASMDLNARQPISRLAVTGAAALGMPRGASQVQPRMVASIEEAPDNATELLYDTSPGRTANLLAIRTVSWDAASGVNRVQTRVRYTYDAANRLATVSIDLSPQDGSVADGKVYTVVYNYDGDSKRISSMSQSDGTRMTVRYDSAGRVESITNALGEQTSFLYDAEGADTIVIDPLGNRTEYEYDPATGQLIRVATPVASRLFYYDAAGEVTSVVDGEGQATVFQYDARGNRTQQRDALGNRVDSTYDAGNLLQTETHYPGWDGAPMVTRHIHDAAGRRLLRFHLSAEGRVTEYRYDSYGQRASSIEYTADAYPLAGLAEDAVPTEAMLAAWVGALADKSRSVRTDFHHDFRGQLDSQTVYGSTDGDGNGVAASAAVTRFAYDPSGRLLRRIAPVDSGEQATSYLYDGLGRILFETDALNQVTAWIHDDAGNHTSMTAANGRTVLDSYDRAGRLVMQSEPDAGPGLAITRYGYDASGQLRVTTDATGVANWLFYDAAGRVIGAIDGNGGLTETLYDGNDRITKTIRHAGAVQTGALRINPDGSPGTAALMLTLDDLRPQPDPARDQPGWNAYDLAGRLVKSVSAAGAVTQTVYDGSGRVASVTRYANAIYTDTLSAGWTPQDINPLPDLTLDRVTRYFYDNDGLLRATLDPENFLTETVYDAAGRAWQTIRYAQPARIGAGGQTPLPGFAFRPRRGALPVIMAAPVGAGDSAWLLDSLRPEAEPASDIRSFIVYDARGLVAGEIDGEAYLTEHAYDAGGRRTASTRYAAALGSEVIDTIAPGATVASLRPDAGTADQTERLSWDALNRIAGIIDAEGTETRYDYDRAGNLVWTSSAWNSPEQRIQTRRYDMQGRLTGELGGEGSARLALLGPQPTPAEVDAIWRDYGTAYFYDAAGRRASAQDSAGKRTLYYYNAAGQLTHVINALGEVDAHSYNVLHQLSASTRYARRLGAALANLRGGLEDATFTGLLAALADPAADSITRHAYGRDGRLSRTTDALGNISLADYNSFGEQVRAVLPLREGAYAMHAYVYDRRGLQTTLLEDATGLRIATSTQYDAFGRASVRVDGRSNTSHYRYDRLGRVVGSVDANNIGRSASYDAFGRVLTQTDGNGQVTRSDYDLASRSMTVTTPEGIAVRTERNRHGQTVQRVDGRVNSISHRYDLDGRLLETRDDAMASSMQWHYDTLGRPIETVDENDVLTRSSYDAAGRLLMRTVDPQGLALTTRWTYDAQGRLVSSRGADGVVTETVYDRMGQAMSVTLDPGGLNLTTTYRYDARGNMLRMTEAAGTPAATATAYAYDALGRRISVTLDPDGLRLTTRQAYDANGNLLRSIDPLGNATRYVYDAGNRLVYAIDALGAVVEYGYDAEGREISVTRYAIALGIDALPDEPAPQDLASRLSPSASDQRIRTVYDGDGRAVARIDALNYLTRSSYDGNGNLVATTAYANPVAAPAGLAPAELQGLLRASADDRLTRHVYDAAHRLAYTVSAADTVTAYARDRTGRVVREVAYANPMALPGQPDLPAMQSAIAAHADPGRDRVSRTVHDAAGRAVYRINAIGYVEQRTYDQAGRLVRSASYEWPVELASEPTEATMAALLASGAAGKAIVTAQTWDAAGRLIDSISGSGSVTHRDYDRAGRITDLTRAYGSADASRTHSVWDGAGRLLAQTLGAGSDAAATTRHVYDANGNEVATIEARGGALLEPYTTRRKFDAAGRVIRVTDPLGGVTLTHYDAFGNAVMVIDPRGNGGSFRYDANNRLVDQTDPEGWVTQTRYGLGGTVAGMVQLAQPSGTGAAPPGAGDQVTRFVYDKRDRLLLVTDAEGYSEAQAWDALGNRVSGTSKVGGVTLYRYDRLGQLIAETLPVTSLDGAGQPSDVVNRYEYDAYGRRITTIEAAGLPEQRITRYEFDADGRQVRKIGEAPGDAQGNSVTPVELQVWDAIGRLIESSDANRNRTLFYYDAQDRRIASLDALGTLSTWRYDAGKLPVASTVYADALMLPAQAGGAAPLPLDAANGRETLYGYDANNRLELTAVHAVSLGVYDSDKGQYQLFQGDIVTRRRHDANGNLVQDIDANGNATSYYYSGNGHRILQIDAEGYGTAWRYDRNGKPLSETRFAQPLLRAPALWEDGAALASTWPSSPEDRITEYSYDRNGRLLEERRLNVVYSSVDANGALGTSKGAAIVSYLYNGLGLVTRQVDANGAITDIGYDRLGRKTREQGAAFVDFEDALVRPTTASEYDGLGNVTRSIRRGKDDSTEDDDQVTRYQHGAGGRLQRTIDPAGVTSYAWDAAGNMLRKERPRLDADGNAIVDLTLYRYDAKNREVEHRDAATGMAWQTRYNAFGEIVAKGANDGWQELAQYDKAGRLFKGNAGDGVTRAYVYDAAGNATLTVESSGPDLGPLRLSELLQAANGALDPDALDAAGVHLTIAAHDRRGLLTDTWQPRMALSYAAQSLRARTDTVRLAPGTDRGMTVTVVDSESAAGVLGPTGMTPAGKGIAGRMAGGTVELRLGWGEWPSTFLAMNLPAGIEAWGDGDIFIEAQAFGPAGNLLFTDNSTQPGGPRSVYFQVKDRLRTESVARYTISIYKRLLTGDRVLVQQTELQGPLPWNQSIRREIPKLVLLRSESQVPAAVVAWYRPLGSTGSFEKLPVLPYAMPGMSLGGSYAIDWSAIARGSYEIRMMALDEQGNVLDFKSGAMVLSDTGPSLALTPETYGPAMPASYSFESGSVLNITAQGANALSMLVRYRPAGSGMAWSEPQLLEMTRFCGAARPGWFWWDYGRLAGDYEVIFESYTGAGSQGEVINKLYSNVHLGGPDSFLFDTVISARQDRPGAVQFNGNLVDARRFTLAYRLQGKLDWDTVSLAPDSAEGNTFTWDTSALAPFGASAVVLEFRFEASDEAGQPVSLGSGTLELKDGVVRIGPGDYDRIVVTAGAVQAPASASGQPGAAMPGKGVAVQLLGGTVDGQLVYAGSATGPAVFLSLVLPEGLDAWGEGEIHIETRAYDQNGALFDIGKSINPTGTRSVFFQLKDLVWKYSVSKFIVSVYKRPVDGGQYLVLQSEVDHRPQEGEIFRKDMPKLLLFRPGPVMPATVAVYYRPGGSTGAFSRLEVQPYANDGVARQGWYAGDWSGIARGSYDVRIIALDADGNLLDFKSGAMLLSDTAPSLVLKDEASGPAAPASFIFESDHAINMTAQGANARSMLVRYRALVPDAAWSDAQVLEIFQYNGQSTPGWFYWDYGALAGDFELSFETHGGAGGSGDIVGRLYGKVRLNGWASTFAASTISAYQDQPGVVTFGDNPANASRLAISYRRQGSAGGWSTVSLRPTSAGSGVFLWDASALAPHQFSSFGYEVQFMASDDAGQVVKLGSGVLQLGLKAGWVALQGAETSPVLIFSPDEPAARTMALVYRLRGGGAGAGADAGYRAAPPLLKAADGSFRWDASALIPLRGSDEYEYLFDLFDSAGQPLGRRSGYFTVGTSTSANEIQWVFSGVVSSDSVIHRSQRTNAFAEVTQETDGHGYRTDLGYNTLGQLSVKLDPVTRATLENGFVVEGLRPQTMYLRDRSGQVLALQDANGNVYAQAWLPGAAQKLAVEYHADGGIRRFKYDVFGNQRHLSDELGRSTDYRYDKSNRLVRMDRPRRDPGIPGALPERAYEIYQYDAAGNRIVRIVALDLASMTEASEKTAYDSLGRIIEVVSGAGRTTRYQYEWMADIAGLDGIARGGFQKTTTTANGLLMVDRSDVFGRLMQHRDLGGHVFDYTYNAAGWLMRQHGSSGQDIRYKYYANGYLKEIRDLAGHSLSSFEYDAEGNKTFESYALLRADNVTLSQTFQQARIDYDELGRIRSISDPRARIAYEYDAAGNRRRVFSIYHDGVNGALRTQEYWYRYDSMNRFIVTMGTLAGPFGSQRAGYAADAGVAIVAGDDGVQIGYDLAGQRIAASMRGEDGRLHVETYGYTADGYLEDTRIDTVLRAQRSSDAMGRVTGYLEFNAGGGRTLAVSTLYDKDNLSESATQDDGKQKVSIIYQRMADGTLQSTISTQGSTTTTTTYEYVWWDSAKQSTIKVQASNGGVPGWQPGYSQLRYDVNGHLSEALDDAGGRRLRYVSNAQGLVLVRDEIDDNAVARIHKFYYADGRRVGDVGNDGPQRYDYVEALAQDRRHERKTAYTNFRPISSADFDQNYEPINADYPAAVSAGYIVRKGDTLQSIADTLWGDSAMWYLIADANGLAGRESLPVGMSLRIPNKLANIHNNHDTFRVYSPGEAIGNVAPTLPEPPPQGDGCGIVGKILVVAIAVVVTVMTAGALAAPAGSLATATLGSMATAGMSVLGGTAATLSASASIMIGAAAGAMGSIVSQGVGIAFGLQDRFSWSGVALAALGAGVGAGIGGATGIGARLATALGAGSQAAQAAVSAALGNSLTQGIALAAGLQRKFDWRAVAASALGAAAGNQAGAAAGGAGSFAGKMASGLAGNVVGALVSGQPLDWETMAADTLGNALGSSLIEMARGSGGAGDREALLDDGAQESERGMSADPDQGPETAEGGAGQPPRQVRARDYQGSLERIARERLGRGASQGEIGNYVGQLFEINGISNARTIRPGQMITLPDADTPAAGAGLRHYGKDMAKGRELQALAAGHAEAARPGRTVGPITLSPISVSEIFFPAISRDAAIETNLAILVESALAVGGKVAGARILLRAGPLQQSRLERLMAARNFEAARLVIKSPAARSAVAMTDYSARHGRPLRVMPWVGPVLSAIGEADRVRRAKGFVETTKVVVVAVVNYGLDYAATTLGAYGGAVLGTGAGALGGGVNAIAGGAAGFVGGALGAHWAYDTYAAPALRNWVIGERFRDGA